MFVSRVKRLIHKEISILIHGGAGYVIMGSYITKFVSLFGSIFLVRLLTKYDYGILSYFENFASYLTIFAGGGFAAGLQRYIILLKSGAEKKACYNYSLQKGNTWNFVLTLAGILICLLYPHPENFKNHWLVGAVLTAAIPFSFFVTISLSTLRGRFDHMRYALMSFITAFVLVGSRVIGAVQGGLAYTTISRFFAEIICAVFCSIYVYRRYFIGINASLLDVYTKKEMSTYSLHIMLTDGIWAIFMLNDIFLLGQISGSETIIADYKVASVIPANLSVLVAGIGIFVAPYFTKHENDMLWLKRNLKIVVATTMAIMFTVIFLCYILAEPLMTLLYGSEYIVAIPTMRTLLVACFFNNGIRASIANVLSAIGKQKFNLIIAVTGIILQVILDVIFIPIKGGLGAAYASLFTYILMSLLLLIICVQMFSE